MSCQLLCALTWLSWIVRRQVGVDIDPYRLRLRVFAHHFESHLAPVAGLPHPAEGRPGMHPFVAVDPDHAGFHVARDLVRTLQIACPQTAAETVFGAICDRQRFLVGLEGRDGDEWAENLFLT